MSATKEKSKSRKNKKSNKNIPSKALKVTPENKCSFCIGSKCCNYVTHQIDTPRKMREFDYLLWLISHPQVELFKDEDGWFLTVVNTPCSHLLANGGCGIYEKRPMICRDHSNDVCEFDEDAEDSFKLYFAGYDDLDKYCRKRFKKWDKRFKKWLKNK